MMKIFILLAALSVTGCATRSLNFPTSSVISSPELGQLESRRLGDSLLRYAKLEMYEAIIIRNSGIHSDGLLRIQFLPTPIPALYIENGSLIYAPACTRMTNAVVDGFSECDFDPQNMNAAQLRAKVLLPQIKEKFDSTGGSTYTYTLPGWFSGQRLEGDVERTEIYLPGENSFSQELIYNGLSCDTVSFTYREFSGDQIRGWFNQTASYDLSKSKTIGFKSAQIEIVSVDNVSISYRVLSHFDGIF